MWGRENGRNLTRAWACICTDHSSTSQVRAVVTIVLSRCSSPASPGARRACHVHYLAGIANESSWQTRHTGSMVAYPQCVADLHPAVRPRDLRERDGPHDYARRLETDADDGRRLSEHVIDELATVFGSSAGGVVALDVLTHHPSVVRALLPFPFEFDTNSNAEKASRERTRTACYSQGKITLARCSGAHAISARCSLP
jgi:hypothetical protein